MLLKEYNDGKILQVNNNIDNKEFMKSKNFPQQTIQKIPDFPIESEKYKSLEDYK